MRLDADLQPPGLRTFLDFADPGCDGPQPVRVADASRLAGSFDLDRNGFALAETAHLRIDYRDEAAVVLRYYPEVELLLRRAAGFSRVFAFDHVLRRPGGAAAEPPVTRTEEDGGEDDEAAARPVQEPLRQVHGGETATAALLRMRQLLGSEARALLRRRMMFVTVWRPIAGAARLALCDADSIPEGDVTITPPAAGSDGDAKPSLRFSRRHRWMYFPTLEPDEVLVMKDYDTADDGRAKRCFRAAIDDAAIDDAVVSETGGGPQPGPCAAWADDASIEVRAIVVFPQA